MALDRISIAFGGNLLANEDTPKDVNYDAGILREMIQTTYGMLPEGSKVVWTHGSGVPFGRMLHMLERESAGEITRIIQENIGMDIQRAIVDMSGPVVPINYTRMIVDSNDPAMHQLVKGVGDFKDKSEFAPNVKLVQGEDEDTVWKWRPAFASPDASAVHRDDLAHIEQDLDRFGHVIAGGGGGRPWDIDGMEVNYPIILDKDRAAQMIASGVKSRILVIVTKVPGYFEGSPMSGKLVERMTVAEARDYIEAMGKNGSMEPKLRAIADFAEKNSGADGVITDVAHLRDVLRGDFSGVTSIRHNLAAA